MLRKAKKPHERQLFSACQVLRFYLPPRSGSEFLEASPPRCSYGSPSQSASASCRRGPNEYWARRCAGPRHARGLARRTGELRSCPLPEGPKIPAVFRTTRETQARKHRKHVNSFQDSMATHSNPEVCMLTRERLSVAHLERRSCQCKSSADPGTAAGSRRLPVIVMTSHANFNSLPPSAPLCWSPAQSRGRCRSLE